ncbi:MAG: class GN sortase [Pseudomonadota bacterium]
MSQAGRLSAALAGGLALLAGAVLAVSGLWIPAKAHLSQILLDRAFEQTLASGGEAHRPWPWADTWPVARLDAGGERLTVLAEGGGEALAFGPAHLSRTALPGERGVSVIAAHRDTHFALLRDLEPGETVTLTLKNGEEQRFVMTGSEVVRHDRSGIDPGDGGPARLALVTCWPFGVATPGPLRYVAWLEPVQGA